MLKKEYLGDAVYASHHGEWNIELTVEPEEGEVTQIIYLEPATANALRGYINRVIGAGAGMKGNVT